MNKQNIPFRHLIYMLQGGGVIKIKKKSFPIQIQGRTIEIFMNRNIQPGYPFADSRLHVTRECGYYPLQFVLIIMVI